MDFTAIKKAADLADTSIKAVQVALADDLRRHASALEAQVNGEVAKVEDIFTKTVPAWSLGVAGIGGLFAGLAVKLFA